MMHSVLTGLVAMMLAGAGLVPVAAAPEVSGPEVSHAVFSDSDVSLRKLGRKARTLALQGRRDQVGIAKPNPDEREQYQADTGPAQIPDPTGPQPGEVMPAADGGFDGLSFDDTNAFGWGYYPPDTDGDIGINHYVQIVNAALGVYSRTGEELLKIPTYDLFAGMPNACATDNDGDGIVQYDQFADRWLISQFAVSTAMGGNGPYFECVAISKTPDPTGAYYRYAFAYDDFPDYPKIGVWPDGYYVTYNMFGAGGFLGTKMCALERDKMLIGGQARQICFDKQREASLLPADVDGPEAPPPGAPNYLLGESWDSDQDLVMYRFAVDWSDTSASELSSPATIRVNRFDWACIFVPQRNNCVRQPGTDQMLDSVGGRMMYRLAYRNENGTESLLANHSVAMDEQVLPDQLGVGWYELRDLDAPIPTVHQQGTTADPDGSTSRWMASMAMDGDGNIALGYSRSGSTTYPSIGITGRLAGDPPNQMTQAEQVVGPQTEGVQLGDQGRWGDYTAMQIDPVDDCTFWYTNQYMAPGQTSRSWRTWVTSFKYPGCDNTPDAPSAPPTEVSAVAEDAVATVSWTAPTISEPIVGYEVTAAPGGAKCWTWTDSCSIAGLTNGTEYSFTVRTYNAAGSSDPSDPSNPVKPAGKPSAPSSVTVVAGQGSATVSWGAASANGSAVTGYVVASSPQTPGCTTSALSCVVSGLRYGVAYTFSVRATNGQGAGPTASARPVTLRFAGSPKIVVRPTTVKPGGRVTVSLTGSNRACKAVFSLGSVNQDAVIGADGAASVVFAAPKPNRTYSASATQAGAACVEQTLSAQVRVKGVYIDGPSSVTKATKRKFVARELPAGKKLSWRIIRKGEVLKKVTKRATDKGTSVLKYRFARKGNHRIVAKGKYSAVLRVAVR